VHYHRDERDEFVGYLATMFPRCFFEDSEQRLPLKKDIVADLEQRCNVTATTLTQMIDWYTSDFAYQRKLLSGAERIDLDGKRAGTVTSSEQEAALRKVAARKKEMAERRAALSSPPAPVKPPATNGHAPDGETMSKTPDPLGKITAADLLNLPPAIRDMHQALTVAGDILVSERYAALRPVLAVAALKEIIRGAEELIGSLPEGRS
jgi:sRNA-binding protein